MHSIWLALIWKEWREYRWKIAALTAIFVGSWAGVCLLIHSPVVLFDVAEGVLLAGSVLAAWFLGMSAAAREQGTGTIDFLQKQPASMRRAAIAKLAFALAGIVVPVLATVAAVWGWQTLQEDVWPAQRSPLWGIEGWYVAQPLAAAALGASVLAWFLSFGVNCSDEIRAAALGFVAIVFVWGAFALMALFVVVGNRPLPATMAVAAAALPGGFFALGSELALQPVLLYLCAFVAFAVPSSLFAWYVVRFGRVPPVRLQTVERQAPRVASRPAVDWLAPPRRSPLAATIWKQMRESAPLAILGGAAVAGIFVAVAVALGLRRSGSVEDNLRNLLEAGGAIWTMVGYAIAVVAGIGIFMDDLQPELQGFWRSRPIRIGTWFAVKLATGLVVTLSVVAAGLIVVLTVASAASHENIFSVIERDDLLEAGGIICLHTGVFLVALAAMTVLRHPIYAGLLAMASPLAFIWLVQIVFEMLEVFTSAPDCVPGAIMLVGMVAAGIFAALIAAAWTAVKHDWGWRH